MVLHAIGQARQLVLSCLISPMSPCRVPLANGKNCAHGAVKQVACGYLVSPCIIFPPPSRSFDAESCCVFLPCSHIYHDRCLRKWYETGKAIDGACPLCKRSIIPASMTEATESDDHNNAENGSNISGEGENASSAQVEMASSVPELTHQAAGAV